MKILITGAAGQLGTALQGVYAGAPSVTLVAHDRDNLDITKVSSIAGVVNEFKPDVIINSAAYNAVEKAGEEITAAFALNTFGPYWLALAASHIGAIFVHVSTDYVFDGIKGEYDETDSPNPLNVYGASKLAGEQLVLLACEKSYVVRTSWLFGANAVGAHNNFVGTMLARAQTDSELRVVDDQVGVPTFAPDLAAAIKSLLDCQVPAGIYHITNSGFCSRYEQAKKIFSLKDISTPLIPIATTDSATKVKRPKKTILLNNRLRALGLPALRPWEEALAEYLESLDSNYN